MCDSLIEGHVAMFVRLSQTGFLSKYAFMSSSD